MTDFALVGEIVREATDSFDLVYAFIIGLPALAGVFATLYMTMKGQRKSEQRLDDVDKKTTETLYQVQNSHTENLRDEISRGFREIREDIRALREELHTERKERIEGDRR